MREFKETITASNPRYARHDDDAPRPESRAEPLPERTPERAGHGRPLLAQPSSAYQNDAESSWSSSSSMGLL